MSATVTEFAPRDVEASTGEKPQSKVWTFDGQTWAALGLSDGLTVCRFSGSEWLPTLRVSPQLGIQADVKVVNDVVHLLLHRSSGWPSAP